MTTYFNYFRNTFCFLLLVLLYPVLESRAQTSGSLPLDKERVRSAIEIYNRLWDEWRQSKSSSKYCASLYTDKAFRNQESGSIGELVRELSKSID